MVTVAANRRHVYHVKGPPHKKRTRRGTYATIESPIKVAANLQPNFVSATDRTSYTTPTNQTDTNLASVFQRINDIVNKKTTTNTLWEGPLEGNSKDINENDSVPTTNAAQEVYQFPTNDDDSNGHGNVSTPNDNVPNQTIKVPNPTGTSNTSNDYVPTTNSAHEEIQFPTNDDDSDGPGNESFHNDNEKSNPSLFPTPPLIQLTLCLPPPL